MGFVSEGTEIARSGRLAALAAFFNGQSMRDDELKAGKWTTGACREVATACTGHTLIYSPLTCQVLQTYTTDSASCAHDIRPSSSLKYQLYIHLCVALRLHSLYTPTSCLET